MQRSAIALLKGDILHSVQLYPALLPLLALLTVTALHFVYRFRAGAKVITALQIIVVSIITIHFIYKIFTHQIFQ